MDTRLCPFMPVVSCLVFVILCISVADRAKAATWDSLQSYTLEDSADPVLTVEGKLLGNTTKKFSLNILTQLPAATSSVRHPVTGQRNQYTGIPLDAFLRHLGIAPEATYIIVRASNNYKSVVKLSDISRYDYLLSYKKNGQFYDQLPADEDRGPLAIVINFDKHPELDFDIYKHQQVWFVESMTVK